MAALLPPPKRQKVYHGIPEPVPELPAPSPNIVVQFVSEDDGTSLAPAINLPANVSREDLQVLINRLTSKVSLGHFSRSTKNSLIYFVRTTTLSLSNST